MSLSGSGARVLQLLNSVSSGFVVRYFVKRPVCIHVMQQELTEFKDSGRLVAQYKSSSGCIWTALVFPWPYMFTIGWRSC